MTNKFFQMPMLKSSMKYLGVLTPYKGLRVYTRAAMGMPGSTEHLDKLMTRVLGDLMEDGIVVKLADNFYTGACSISDLIHIWERILQCFATNNLHLSAGKTRYVQQHALFWDGYGPTVILKYHPTRSHPWPQHHLHLQPRVSGPGWVLTSI